MKYFLFGLALLFTVFISSCASSSKLHDHSLSRNRNACKRLCGKVMVYVVFVDTKTGPKWNDTTIRATLAMYKEATDWVGEQAKKNNIKLSIQIKSPSPNVPVESDFPVKNIGTYKSFDTRTIKKLLEWTNGVSKKVGANISDKKANDSMPSVIFPKDAERLIAHLRNQYNTESVALFFQTNNNNDNSISLPLNTLDNKEIEQVINSYQNSGVIAYELLSLFGAEKLFYSKNGHSKLYAEMAAKEFPGDLMTNPFAGLSNANISKFTSYLVGWTNEIDKQYFKFFKY